MTERPRDRGIEGDGPLAFGGPLMRAVGSIPMAVWLLSALALSFSSDGRAEVAVKGAEPV